MWTLQPKYLRYRNTRVRYRLDDVTAFIDLLPPTISKGYLFCSYKISTLMGWLPLAPMQRAGRISSPNQKRKNTFPDGTLIVFPSQS